MTRKSLQPKQVVQAAAGFVLSAVLLIWGLPHFAKTSWHEVWAVVGRVPPARIGLFLGLLLLGLWSYTFTLTASLPGLRHFRALVLNVCGSAVSNLLPGGGAVGLAATYGICRSWGFSIGAVSTSAIVTGVWNVLARILLPIIAVGVLAAGASDLPQVMRDAAVAAVASGVGIVAVFAAVLASERAALAVGQVLDRLLGPLRRRMRRTGDLESGIRGLRSRTIAIVSRRWPALTLGLVGYFGFYYLLFMMIMRTTGVELFHGQIFAAFAIGRLLTAVGVTPGGLGVTETGTAAALVAWGAEPAEATAGVVLFSVFTHVMEIPLGALGWLAWSVLPRQAPGADEDPARAADPPPAAEA